MFSVVLLAALTAGENSADFHFRSCYGGSHSCYGACYGACYGGFGLLGKHHKACYGGCYGACYGSCFGGCYGACYGSCMGMACYGCFGTCTGGCFGAPYAGYGPAYSGCAGGCGGYISPAYGVPGPVIGVPMPATPSMPAPTTPSQEAQSNGADNRARVVFTLPENAKLFVEGQLIENAAEIKTFRTPVLDVGKTYVYTIRIEVNKDGDKMVGETTLNVQAGREEKVDLTTVELKKVSAVATR